MVEFLKFKENQNVCNIINESDSEYISEEERLHLEEITSNCEFIDQEDLIKELRISKDEI